MAANSLPAPMGFNSAVIKPETRVNKSEEAGQILETEPLCPYCLKRPIMSNNAIACEECSQMTLISGQQPKCETCSDTGTAKVICRPLDEEIPQYIPCQDCKKGKALTQPDWRKQIRGPSSKTNYYPLSCDKPEQPNLKIIAEIEGLISQVNDKLYKIREFKRTKQLNIRTQALEEIDLFQKNTLFELRKAFE